MNALPPSPTPKSVDVPAGKRASTASDVPRAEATTSYDHGAFTETVAASLTGIGGVAPTHATSAADVSRGASDLRITRSYAGARRTS